MAESEKKIANISKPEQCSIPSLEVGGEVASSDTEKANMLARFFSRQCSNSSESQEEELGCPCPLPDGKPTFDFQPILAQTVLKHLQWWPLRKSSSCPYLTNRVLCEIYPVIYPSLSYLYNLSVSTCVFPTSGNLLLCVRFSKTKENLPTGLTAVRILLRMQ